MVYYFFVVSWNLMNCSSFIFYCVPFISIYNPIDCILPHIIPIIW